LTVTDTVTITFPVEYKLSDLAGFACVSVLVEYNEVTGISCILYPNNTISISNVFVSVSLVSSVIVTFSNITNPTPAIQSSPFLATIGHDTATNSINSEVTFVAGSLLSTYIHFDNREVDRYSNMVFTIMNRNNIPIDGIITIKFPTKLTWTRDISGNLIPINGALICKNMSINTNAAMTCSGSSTTQVITITNAFSYALIKQ
jgi:hypothetical protein